MADSTLNPELGVKMATLVAGFAGGVVSLSYVRELSKAQAFMAVITGSLFAGYATPVANHYFALPGELENGVAFIIGLTAMNIIPGIINLSDRFRKNPQQFWGKRND